MPDGVSFVAQVGGAVELCWVDGAGPAEAFAFANGYDAGGGHAFDRVGAFHLPEEREHHHGELRHGIFRGWPGPLGRHALRLRLRPSALCRDLPLSSSSIGSGSKGCATVSSPVNGTVESKPSDSAALCSSWCWMVKCRRIQMVARARELVLHNGGGVQW